MPPPLPHMTTECSLHRDPCAQGLEVQGTHVEGSVVVVACRLNVNLNALTLSQVVSKRRKLCVDMVDSMAVELAQELEQDSKWAAAMVGLPELRPKAEAALGEIRARLLGKAPEVFNDDEILARQAGAP